MLFFRSEEHLENWTPYNPELKDGIISLQDLMTLFTGNFFQRRMDPDYVSNMKKYMFELAAVLPTLTSAGNFWKL
jgi:hypothetical protein